MARVLSISYDSELLRTRELMLRQVGVTVESVVGLANARRICKSAKLKEFDLIVICHSVVHDEKGQLIRECLGTCSCPVLALLRQHEPPVDEATRSVCSDEPGKFINAVQELLEESNAPTPR